MGFNSAFKGLIHITKCTVEISVCSSTTSAKIPVLGLDEYWNTDPQPCHYRFWNWEAVLCRGTGHTSWKVSEFPSTFDFK